MLFVVTLEGVERRSGRKRSPSRSVTGLPWFVTRSSLSTNTMNGDEISNIKGTNEHRHRFRERTMTAPRTEPAATTEATNSTTSDTAAMTWTLYIGLLVVRVCICPFLRGYIHPDEFFQSGQELWYGCLSQSKRTPWEFLPQNALRSVFPPTLLTWMPLQLYQYIWVMIKNWDIDGIGSNRQRPHQLSGLEILIIPRVMCAILSIVMIDSTIWKLSTITSKADVIGFRGSSDEQTHSQRLSRRRQPVPTSVLLLASSWPALGMLSRPFSNSLESCILAVLLRLTLTRISTVTRMTTKERGTHDKYSEFTIVPSFVGIGALCALGTFTRFTFIFFGFPPVLALLIEMFREFGWRRIRDCVVRITCIGFALIAVTISIVVADSRYYNSVVNEVEHSSMDHPTSKPWFVLTPLNALIYNSQTSNLKDHGLHPRWTHAVVNMFILFGPLTIVAYYMIVTKCVKVIYTRIASVKTDHRKSDNKYKEGNHSVVMVCMTTVLCGLGFLSLAPHQEPRFLLPLVTPLVLLGAQSQIFKSRLVVFVWILFNAVLLLLFGVLHQAGVTSSLLNINSILESIQDGNAKAVIFSRTYMPPSFLARQSKALDNISSSSDIDSMTCEASGNGDGDCPIFARKLLDLNGSTMQVLMDTLENELRCGHNNNTIDDFVLVLVPPLSEELESGDRVSFLADWGTSDNLLGKIFECNHVSYYAPHLTTEDLPPFVSDTSVVDYLHQFSLNSYRISCKAYLN